ncbi:MAG: redoxin domain-containing protein [Gemmatimonadaceae bacterium]
MIRSIRFPAVALLIAAPFCLQAQKPVASPAGSMAGMSMSSAASVSAPEVGQMAPEFSANGADMNGARSVSLKSLRGQVVVLAFYPKDRSSGCTHELNKFRDEYTKIFGSGVTVLPISEDSVDSHAGWARDAKFPFTLVSDDAGKIAGDYGSIMPGRPYANRTVFVVGKDGKVTYRDMKFGALDQHAYDALTAAVAKAKTE